MTIDKYNPGVPPDVVATNTNSPLLDIVFCSVAHGVIDDYSIGILTSVSIGK